MASQTRDKNRTVADHVRALCAGGLITWGLCESLKKIATCEGKETGMGAGLCLAGALLLSSTDVKNFFGLQKGFSLNPPVAVKERIKKLAAQNHNVELSISRLVSQCAERGRIQSLPFIVRLFSRRNRTYYNETPKNIVISELDFVTKVLPYLRTEAKTSQIADDSDSRLVFSVNSDETVGLNPELTTNYASLDAYEKSIN